MLAFFLHLTEITQFGGFIVNFLIWDLSLNFVTKQARWYDDKKKKNPWILTPLHSVPASLMSLFWLLMSRIYIRVFRCSAGSSHSLQSDFPRLKPHNNHLLVKSIHASRTGYNHRWKDIWSGFTMWLSNTK